VEQFSKDLCTNLFGNPHSASPSSALSTQRVESVRSRVLKFFKADPEHFDCIFVANATAAIKLVMYSFQDCGSKLTSQKQPGFWYGYHTDAHTSLVGVRQVALAGSRCFKSDEEVEDWLQGKSDPANQGYNRPNDSQLGLFAYPAQSNMNGHRLPLTWAGRVRSSMHQNTYTMLDAAAYVSTAQLDLSNTDMAPDFTAFSFYKIFGFPDLGALIVRKAAGHLLQQRRYFGGGTVDMVIAVDDAWYAKKHQKLHEELEDGTLPFHNIIALDSALDTHERIFGSMSRISAHACYLAKRLYDGLNSLQHKNGLPMCEIYKHPKSTYGDSITQAPTVAFNLRNSQGGWIGKSDVEQLAIIHGIQLRTGGVCNPGGIATYLSWKPWELRKNFAEGLRCGNDLDVLSGKPTGVVRVSLGAMSNRSDVDHFLHFVREVFLEVAPTPALGSMQDASPDHLDTIRSVTVYPVRGAKGWQVPREMPWELKEARLMWDQEWCLVSTATGETLNAEDHPRLLLLEPSLHVKEGLLRIAFPSTDPTKSTQGVSVSLWESPPTKPDQLHMDTNSRRADAYSSASLAELFTSIIGVPCTLARYPDHHLVVSRHMDQERRRDSQTQPPSSTVHVNAEPRCASSSTTDPALEKCFTISTSADSEDRSTIQTTSTSSLDPSWQYIRIGSHYFRIIGKPNAAPVSCAHLRRLPNVFDLSPRAQNPTIKAGDTIQTFSVNEAAENEALKACIASESAKDFICPVPSCKKECETEEERGKHLLVHQTGPPAKATNAGVEVEQGNKSGQGRAGLLGTVKRWSGTGKENWRGFVLAATWEIDVRRVETVSSETGQKERKEEKRRPRRKMGLKLLSMFNGGRKGVDV
jgi:molybdenum cofactor sulfurtransferase